MTIAEAYHRLAVAIRELKAGGWIVRGDARIEPLSLDPPATAVSAAIVPLERVTTNPAAQAAYTGGICSNCGSGMVVRAGACEVCRSCGSTTSCG